MQAGKSEAARADRCSDQPIAAVGAEAHLISQPLVQHPADQLLAGALQGPIEVLRAVDAMHRQVVEPIDPQLLEAAAHVVLGAGQALVRKHFAGDYQLLAAEPQAPDRLP